jgi:hypothetical protein
MTSSTAAQAKTLGFRSLVVLGGAAVAVSALALPSRAATTPAFTSSQARLLDTRTTGTTDPGPVSGLVPVMVTAPTGSTVELTITSTAATGPGNVVAYPAASAAPGTSDLNLSPGHTVASTVVVPVPASGIVDVDVRGSATQLVVDQQGYFAGTALTGAAPVRVADSRQSGDGFVTVGPQTGIKTVQLPSGSYTAGEPVALNVTAIPAAAGAGYITAYTPAAAPPATSTVNFQAAQIASNLVFVTPSATGTVDLKFSGPATNVLVDVEAAAPAGSTLTSTSARVVDTRVGTGLRKGALTPGAYSVTIPAGDAPAGTTGVVLNITATPAQSGSGFITAYPGSAKPATSELQFTKGQTVAQTVVVPVTSTASPILVTLGVSDSSTQVVVDTEGYVTNG